jgi:hypothetical protein
LYFHIYLLVGSLWILLINYQIGSFNHYSFGWACFLSLFS